MRRIFTACLAVLMLIYSFACLAEESDNHIVLERDIHDLHLTVDAYVNDTVPQEAKCYTVTPLLYDADSLISFFWPSDDFKAIKSSVSVLSDGIKKDGKSLYTEIFENKNGVLFLNFYEGTFYFATNFFKEWGYDNSDWNLTAPVEYEFNYSDYVEYLLNTLNRDFKVTQIYVYGIEETKENGEMLRYNTVDYAVTIDGIKCENHSRHIDLSRDEIYLPEQHITISFNEIGLLSVNGCLYEITNASSAERLMSCEEALEFWCKDLEYLFASGDIEINTIALSYIMTPIRGSTLSFTYVPVWKFQTRIMRKEAWLPHNIQDGDEYAVNAITGEVMD